MLAAAAPRGTVDAAPSPTPSRSLDDSGGPLMSLQEGKPDEGSGSPAVGEEQQAASGAASRPEAGLDATKDEPQSKETSSRAERSPKSALSFNAQQVTAVTEAPGKGTLSFRLVKDHPEVPFRGYLFVFVETLDKLEEPKIWAYPDRAKLGDEYLPSDYHEGESLSFKQNSRVELPLRDVRPGAALARVSILLYDLDGSIVFQRGFERKEVKVLSAADRKGGTKRRPL